MDDVQRQRKYYATTAARYDDLHVSARDEHSFALAFLTGVLDHFGFRSVLDIGSGTGRALTYLKERRPDLRVLGVEPVAELREVAYRHGLDRAELIAGDAYALPFADGTFDVVAEFGMLHHVSRPHHVVAEMLRVARKAVMISDSNCFGQGSTFSRLIKRSLRTLRLWRAARYVRTGGKMYFVSEGDGLAYSYSVFEDYGQLQRSCSVVHIVNTSGRGDNNVRGAPHVAMLGIKHGAQLPQPATNTWAQDK